MRDLIILAGGYSLDTMSASAIRALGLAQMIQGLGYRVIILGKFRQTFEDARDPEGTLVNGVTCRDIEQPVAGRPFASYIRSAQPLMQVVDEQGADRVKAIILYNYPALGVWSVLQEVRRYGIAPVLDCTEWYGWEGRKILRNVWRLAWVELRMRLLTRLASNIICASSWFRAKVARQHTVLLPFVLDTSRSEWQRGPAADPKEIVHLVYSGLPGIGMHKDRLPIMLDALARLSNQGHDFRLSIAGITEAQYLGTMPLHRRLIEALGEKVRFLGRIPHNQSLALLRTADFSIFFRKPNRVSNTGFATKFVEAATLGVPVVSNPTSDISLYVRDGDNGILARSFDDADVEEALWRAISMSPESRATMVAACRAENPFDLRLWQDEAKSFFDNLRGGG